MKITVNVTIEILKGSRNKYERLSFEERFSSKKDFYWQIRS
jgi:inorganic pyrophosphatase